MNGPNYLMRAAVTCLCVWLSLSAVPAGAQRPDPDSPKPPAPVFHPPAPPRPTLDKEWMDSVFRRFPDVKPELVMDFIHERFPREVHEVKRLLTRRREDAVDFMSDLIQETLDLLDTRREDPARFEKVMRQRDLDRKAAEQAEAVRRCKDDPERGRRVEALRRTLAEAFVVKQELMKESVADMEVELNELKGLVERREKHREGIILRRIADLTGEKEELDW